MLKLILALAPLALNLTGQSAQPAAAPKKIAASKPVKNSNPDGVPPSAVKIDENTYRFQEKDASGKPGKVYLYRRNPFGFSRVEESEAAKIGTPLPPTQTAVVAVEQGDSYRFERQSPFGAKVWTKKKTELNDEEKAIVQHTPVSVQKAAN